MSQAHSPSVATWVPPRLGRYEVQEVVAHARLVKVFRGFDPNMARSVRLATLSEPADDALSKRFRQEMERAAGFQHKNFAAIYDLAEFAGLPFCAMQDPGDDDLRRAILSRRPLTLLQKVQMMFEAAECIQAAYRGGLSPMGIRPSNVAIGKYGIVIFRDFGIISQGAGQDDEDLFYAAPEVNEGQPADLLSDIFAFGILYYELLTGSHPFAGGEYGRQEIDILRNDAPAVRELMPDCPESLERLVHRALDKFRHRRYQTFEAIQYDAAPILRDLKRARIAQRLAEARRYLDEGDVQDAEKAVTEALELEPGNRRARRLGKAIRNELRPRKVELLKPAPRLDGLMEVSHQIEVPREMAALKQADEEEGDFYHRGREKAGRLLEEGQREQAADLLRNLISLFPDDALLQEDLQAAQDWGEGGEPVEPAEADESGIDDLPPAITEPSAITECEWT